MSQNETLTQIRSVSTVKIPTYADTVASIIETLASSVPVQVMQAKNNCIAVQCSKNMVTTAASANVLHSPTMLKSLINKQFESNLSVMNNLIAVNTDKITQIKAAGLLTLQQANLQTQNPEIIAQTVKNFLNAGTVQVAKGCLDAMISEVKEQHTRVFTKTLSTAIQTASQKIGFTGIKNEIISPLLTRIVATNSNGVNLISEIRTDERKSVDIVTELEGITDGSCVQIMDTFNRELAMLGVVAERKNRKPTGRVPVMEYAKVLNKRRKTACNNEQVLPNREQVKIRQYIDQ